MSLLGAVIFLVVSLIGIAGLVLLAWGIYPRRRGDTPYCRKCGYNLTGLNLRDPEVRCPECGVGLLRKGVRIGERYRRRWAANFGFVLLLFGLLGGGYLLFSSSRTDWVYRHVPLSWLVHDVRYSKSTPWRSTNELQRRFSRDELSLAEISYLIDAWLDELAELPVDGGRVCRTAEALDPVVGDNFWDQATDEQLDRLATNAIRDIRCEVRPRCVSGARCPVRITMTRALPGAFWVSERISEVRHCKGVLHWSHPNGSGSAGGSCVSTSSFGTSIRLAGDGPCALEIDVMLRVGPPDVDLWNESDEPLRQDTLTFKATTTLVPTLSDDPIALARTRALDKEIVQSLTVSELAVRPYYGPSGKFSVSDDIQVDGNLTKPLAFEVYACFDGRTLRLGSITCRAAQTSGYGWYPSTELDRRPPDYVDILLVHSEEVARGTVDFFEIWGGDLLYRDVPVIDESERVPYPLRSSPVPQFYGDIIDADAYLAELRATTQPATQPAAPAAP